MAVILHRFSTEISSSGLGRRPLTAETRVRVPVSLPSKAFIPSRVRVLFLCLGHLCRDSSRGHVSNLLAYVQKPLPAGVC